MTVGWIVHSQCTPLLQCFEIFGGFTGPFRFHQIDGSRCSRKLGIQVAAGFRNCLPPQAFDSGFERLNVRRRCDLFQIGQNAPPDEIDFESKDRVLIGCARRQRLNFLLDSEQFRHKRADVAGHRDEQCGNLRRRSRLFGMIAVIIPCCKQLGICRGDVAIEHIEQFLKALR